MRDVVDQVELLVVMDEDVLEEVVRVVLDVERVVVEEVVTVELLEVTDEDVLVV